MRYLLYAFSPLLISAAIIGWIAVLLFIAIRARRIRFSLRGIFVNITIAAGLLGFIKWIPSQYYWQLNDVKAVLAEYPEIEDIYIAGNDDVCYEADAVYFCVAGQITVVQIPHLAEKAEIRLIVENALAELTNRE
jgi:hypothetical protein